MRYKRLALISEPVIEKLIDLKWTEFARTRWLLEARATLTCLALTRGRAIITPPYHYYSCPARARV